MGGILLLEPYRILLSPVGFLNEEDIHQGIITRCKSENLKKKLIADIILSLQGYSGKKWMKEFGVDVKPKQGFLKISLGVYIPVGKPCGEKMRLGFKRDLIQLDDSIE